MPTSSKWKGIPEVSAHVTSFLAISGRLMRRILADGNLAVMFFTADPQ